jgi:hypothetical protein
LSIVALRNTESKSTVEMIRVPTGLALATGPPVT